MLFAETTTAEQIAAVIVAILGAGGIASVLTVIFQGIRKARAGKTQDGIDTEKARHEIEEKNEDAELSRDLKINEVVGRVYREQMKRMGQEHAEFKAESKAEIAELKKSFNEMRACVVESHEREFLCRKELAEAKSHIAELKNENGILKTRISQLEARIKNLEDSATRDG